MVMANITLITGAIDDTTVRISAGAGYADQRTDTGLMPFHERRIYGNDAYSYTNGARFYWNRWHTPRLQSLTALEIGRPQICSAHSAAISTAA